MSITATTSTPAGGYRIFSPYTDDDDTAFANHTLCPRYAECDSTSAPPSPASIESLEIFDSIPWRRDYIALDPRTRARRKTRLRAGCMQNKLRATIVPLLLLLAILAAAAALVLYLSVAHGKSK